MKDATAVYVLDRAHEPAHNAARNGIGWHLRLRVQPKVQIRLHEFEDKEERSHLLDDLEKRYNVRVLQSLKRSELTHAHHLLKRAHIARKPLDGHRLPILSANGLEHGTF